MRIPMARLTKSGGDRSPATSADAAWPAPVAVRLAAVIACVAGCAAQPHTDELGVDAHRRAAEHERQKAEAELARYEPSATAPMPGLVPGEANAPYIAFGAWWGAFNPMIGVRDEALRHFAHAAEHEAAAADLEHFAAVECAGIPAARRAACPLLGPVVALTELAAGVRVRLQDGAAVDEIVAEMRCHLAFAHAQGTLRSPSCPLYIGGLTIARSPDGRGVDLLAATPAAVAEVKRLARAHVGAW